MQDRATPDDGTDLERDLEVALAQHDPVPERLAVAAIAAFDRRVDAELAQLVFDSLATTAAAGTRGPGQPRLLTFEGGPLTIDVEVSSATAGAAVERRIVVRLAPAQQAEYELWAGDQHVAGASDPIGRFAVTVPGAGPFRLRCRPADDPHARGVVTQWMTA